MLSPEMWHYSCMNKTILFVPGFQEGRVDRDYDTPMNRWRAMGYAVDFVPIQWHRTMQKQWLQTLHERYRQYDPAETILAGFSFGACIVFLAACEHHLQSVRSIGLSAIGALLVSGDSNMPSR